MPVSYCIESSDHQYILVMRKSMKDEYDDGLQVTLSSGRVLNLAEDFHTNGVHRLDTLECVQPFEWYADQEDLAASEDLKLFLRCNRWAADYQGRTNWDWACKFYKNGKEVREYKLTDLMSRTTFLPRTSHGWRTLWHAGVVYIPSPDTNSSGQFQLKTLPERIPYHRSSLGEGNTFIFDAATGVTKAERRSPPMYFFSVIRAAPAALLLCLGLVIWRVTLKKSAR